MKRTKIVPIRFTEEEYSQIAREANMRGLSISTLIRNQLYKNNVLEFERRNLKDEQENNRDTINHISGDSTN